MAEILNIILLWLNFQRGESICGLRMVSGSCNELLGFARCCESQISEIGDSPSGRRAKRPRWVFGGRGEFRKTNIGARNLSPGL